MTLGMSTDSAYELQSNKIFSPELSQDDVKRSMQAMKFGRAPADMFNKSGKPSVNYINNLIQGKSPIKEDRSEDDSDHDIGDEKAQAKTRNRIVPKLDLQKITE